MSGVFLIALGVWLLWALICARAERLDTRGDVLTGLMIVLALVVLRVVHRVRVEGIEHIPKWTLGDPSPGPLIVAANHTAGLDPVLVQSVSGLNIKWMMARDMMLPGLEPLWELLEVIPVSVTDTLSVRTALRHLKDDGVLGIFPEGGIERPPGRLMPFMLGTGVLVQRSGARVLLAAIDGTATGVPTFVSLFTPSRTRVRFLPVVEYAGKQWTPESITADMRARLSATLGWPEPATPAIGDA